MIASCEIEPMQINLSEIIIKKFPIQENTIETAVRKTTII